MSSKLCRVRSNLLLACIIVSIIVAGCAPAATPTQTVPTAVPTAIPTVVPTVPTTIKVVDSTKAEVTIPREVKSVASMRSGITEVICALGQKDKIVAVEETVKAGTGYGAFITSVYPDLMTKASPLNGKDVNAEEMLKINPDVVLHGGLGRLTQAQAFQKQAPDIPVVIAHFETLADYMNDIRIVAQCVGATDRGEELITYLQSKLDSVAAAVKDIPAEKQVRVFYGGHDAYHAYGGDTFEHSEIVAAGGKNVAEALTGFLPEVSAEQMLNWDPQVIILLNGVSVDSVLQDTKLANVSAVKNKRVYALPEAGWDFGTPRALFCIEWLAAKLYPERFPNLDIQAEATSFYETVWGVPYQGPALTEAAPTTGATRQVKDMAGRTVTIPTQFQRVVTAFPYVTFTALALGESKLLVGVDTASSKNANLLALYPEIAKIAPVGSAFSMNKESVLMAKPDVVLTVTWDRDPEKTQSTIGVPLVCIDMDYYQESIQFIADLLGPSAQAKAKELLAYYTEHMALIQSKVGDLPVAQRTKVYVGGGNGALSTYGKESTWHFEISDAAGVNVAADLTGGGAQDMSMEQIINWNPDVVILDKSCPTKIAEILNDTRWASVSAVKNKRVYRAPDGYLETFGRPHLESALARVWLADKLYPGKLGIDIVQDAQAFYKQIYGITLSDAELNKLLTPES